MSVEPVSLMGGKSVYCINEAQLNSAFDLAESDSDAGLKIRETVKNLEKELTRNERASVAFVLINHLQHGDS